MAKKATKKAAKTLSTKATRTARPKAKTKPKPSSKAKAKPRATPKPPPRPSPSPSPSLPEKTGPSRAARPKASKEATAPRPAAEPKGPRPISSESIQNATGKTRDEWFAILDGLQADKLAHKDIAKLLAAEHGLGSWWSQMVTVEYERARGLRQPNESSTGGFQVSVSKTINAPIERLDKAWAVDDERARWLGDYPIEIRVAHTQKDMRLTWLSPDNAEGSHVDVAFAPKDGGRRSMVSVQHRKLSGPEDVAWARSFWSIKLEALRSALEK